MINVSNEFYNTMKLRTDFKQFAEVTLKDGTQLTLDSNLFTMDNNSLIDSAQVNTLPVGIAIARSVTLEIINDDEQFSTYDFFGAKIKLYLTFELEATEEKVEFGTFTVISPITKGTTIIITAVDDMYKTDKPYETDLVYPANLMRIFVDICMQCEILPVPEQFVNYNILVSEKPSSDYTFRQVLGFIAMIAGGNARVNRFGKLQILSYDFKFLNSQSDGGHFKPWDQLTEIDGGNFLPWDTGDVLDGQEFTPENATYHRLTQFKNLTIDTDDVAITGIQSKFTDSNDKEHIIRIGKRGYILNVENPLFGTEESNVRKCITAMGSQLLGIKMRRFTGDHIAYPLVEFMDNALIEDKKGNVYATVITDVDFNFCGLTTLKNSADDEIHNSSSYNGAGADIIVSAKKLVQKEKTQRELAIEDLANKLATSSGLYMTQESQPDGSVIYYMHDKPTVEESMVVWKLTAQAIGISTDGGKTYPYGLNVTGEAILSLIYAIGLDADYITTGRISDENNKNSWDLTTGAMQISNGFVNIKGTRTYLATNYSKADADRVLYIIQNNIEPTQEEFKKYDLNINGRIDMTDLVNITRLAKGTINQLIIDTSVKIDGTGKSAYLIKTPKVTIGAEGMSCEDLNTNDIMTERLIVNQSIKIPSKWFRTLKRSLILESLNVPPYKYWGQFNIQDLGPGFTDNTIVLSVTAADSNNVPVPCYFQENGNIISVVANTDKVNLVFRTFINRGDPPV